MSLPRILVLANRADDKAMALIRDNRTDRSRHYFDRAARLRWAFINRLPHHATSSPEATHPTATPAAGVAVDGLAVAKGVTA